MWSTANEVIRVCPLDDIRSINQKSTTVHTSCPDCGRPLYKAGWACEHCNKPTNTCSVWYEITFSFLIGYALLLPIFRVVCVCERERESREREQRAGQKLGVVICHFLYSLVWAISHQIVKGIYVWCQGCGHGGHLEHMYEWYLSIIHPSKTPDISLTTTLRSLRTQPPIHSLFLSLTHTRTHLRFEKKKQTVCPAACAHLCTRFTFASSSSSSSAFP